MTEDGQAAAKKTVTTMVVPATTATAVPLGSADDAGAGAGAGTGTGEVTAPRCLVISIVVLDAIALLFWIFTFFVPYLGFIGLICAIVASILACIIPCQDANGEFRKSINNLMYVHIAFGACYIVSIVLVAAALATGTYAGLGGAAFVFTIINLILLIACLVMASILLCKINKER